MTATLGIDVGTTNTKVVLAAWGAAGVRVVAKVTEPTPGTLGDIEHAVARCVRRCLGTAPIAPDAVAVSSMAETGGPVDWRDGTALGPLVGWADDRARSVLPQLEAATDPGELYRETGVAFGPKPPLAKWAWFAQTMPEAWRHARWVGVADLVVHALTGRYATDHTLAGRTGAFGLDADQFDADLVALGGLDLSRLPDVLQPREAAGTVRPGALDGALPAGIPVFVAGHDHAVGAHAVGVRTPGSVADSLGTSEAVYAVVGATTPQDRDRWGGHGMSVVRTIAGDQHAVIAASASAGGLVAWWCESRPGTTPDELFDGLDRDAPTGAFALPYLRGRQAPFPNPDARFALLGADEHAPDAVLTEALLRGLVLQARWLAEVAVGGRPRESVLLGGPTRNAAWVRRKAELTPWATRRATQPDAVALGAALIAAENLGMESGGIENTGIALAPLPSEPVAATPDPRLIELYEAFVTAALGAPHTSPPDR
ncbi:FGGY-family carbohydrate kinase [Xylanimonas protaetiae]|uniref:Carbohydrate kinase n=1 Tax=Xylanimonas protaetiae TaxID=2509457 RepID=A0A4P6F7F8_9MICO|nr:FGGY family carbohydrate kinase [Xylanimonas protaetiae]QAY71644.1 carbohydrate kinase [Xylanimonas protaetiae]